MEENIVVKWPVKWSKISKKLAIIGWLISLLCIMLIVILFIYNDFRYGKSPPPKSIFDAIYTFTFLVLFLGTNLCFVSSLIMGTISLIAVLYKVVALFDVKKEATYGIVLSLFYFCLSLVLYLKLIFDF